MKITWLIYTNGLCGGNRTIFELVNHLAMCGHEQTIMCKNKFPSFMSVNALTKFQSDEDKLVDLIPESDAIIATWWKTAYWLNQARHKGVSFYFVQHYESWDERNSPIVDKTYRMPFNFVVTSSWVENLLKKRFGIEAERVGNGVDQKIFRPQGKKGKPSILAFYSARPSKDAETLFRTFEILKQKMPSLELNVFGIEKPSPRYTFYKQLPDGELAKLYSRSHIFISTSLYEGWGLPRMEALSSGCNLITTKIGSEDYLRHAYNALIVPNRNPEKTAEATLLLLSNPDYARKLRKNGLKTVKAYTWERCAKKFEKALLKGLN